MRTTIHVTTKDRHSETALMLQSLRTQTYQEWDLILLDDASGGPLVNNYFLMSIINRLKLEGHKVKLLRNAVSQGVCYARNTCIDNDDYGNPYAARLDDDILMEPDYLEKLVVSLEQGWDLVTGVIPLLSQPGHTRQTKMVGKIMNLHEFNDQGDLVVMKDECAYTYDEDLVIPTNQFRTNALYRSELHKIFRYPLALTKTGFREEGFFSLTLQLRGLQLAVRTGAVAYHLQTPSGGCRSDTYAENVKLDNESFLRWAKQKYEENGGCYLWRSKEE